MCTIPGHMAATAENPGSTGSASPTSGLAVQQEKRSNKLWMVIGAMLLVGANAGFWFYRTKVQEHATRLAPSAMPATVQEQEPFKSVALQPFVVNLAGGDGYLKVAITLTVREAEHSNHPDPASKGASQEVLDSPAVRDVILSTLAAQDAGTLLTEEGKTALKRTLQADLNAKAPDFAFGNIYFTEFLVER
jgi:flagellar basal body-associated protein FliL